MVLLELLNFIAGFVQVYVDTDAELIAESPYFGQCLCRDRIGCMRCEHAGQQWCVTGAVVKLASLAQVFVCIACPRTRKVQCDQANACSNAKLAGYPGDCVWKKIHVVNAGYAAAQALCQSESGSIFYKLWVNMELFCGPDMLGQPGHQRQIISETTKQIHCQVSVSIDKPRHQRLSG